MASNIKRQSGQTSMAKGRSRKSKRASNLKLAKSQVNVDWALELSERIEEKLSMLEERIANLVNALPKRRKRRPSTKKIKTKHSVVKVNNNNNNNTEAINTELTLVPPTLSPDPTMPYPDPTMDVSIPITDLLPGECRCVYCDPAVLVSPEDVANNRDQRDNVSSPAVASNEDDTDSVNPSSPQSKAPTSVESVLNAVIAQVVNDISPEKDITKVSPSTKSKLGISRSLGTVSLREKMTTREDMDKTEKSLHCVSPTSEKLSYSLRNSLSLSKSSLISQ